MFHKLLKVDLVLIQFGLHFGHLRLELFDFHLVKFVRRLFVLLLVICHVVDPGHGLFSLGEFIECVASPIAEGVGRA